MSSHLLVQPSSLQFPLTLNKEVVQLLFVSNRSSRRTVTFKVKTTSPRRYSVRPTRGILWPGDQEQITITLRALRKPPSDADDCRDRFKVLSLPLDHGQAMQLRETTHEQRRVLLDTLWDSEEALAHASTKKVHCSFSMPSPSSCSPIPENSSAAWSASSRSGSREYDVPSLAHLLTREDSSGYHSFGDASGRDEDGPAAPAAVRAASGTGGGAGFLRAEYERLGLSERLGLRHRQGWVVDPSYG